MCSQPTQNEFTKNSSRDVIQISAMLLPRIHSKAITIECKFVHFKKSQEAVSKIEEREGNYHSSHTFPHPIWDEKTTNSISITHRDTKCFSDRWAYFSVWTLRKAWDLLSGWSFLPVTEHRAMRRVVFLETVAGVPGMAGAMVRHLNSLRLMRRDNGWIHTLIEEAENERMHLLTALELHQSGRIMRLMILIVQGVFTNFFFMCYLFFPNFCHRFVGYLEEEAVKTYTKILHEIDHGNLSKWKNEEAPKIAVKYWLLKEGATVRDVFAAIRADEAHHREVNHTFADIGATGRNPFGPKIE